jgi:hypothetical protein
MRVVVSIPAGIGMPNLPISGSDLIPELHFYEFSRKANVFYKNKYRNFDQNLTALSYVIYSIFNILKPNLI